MKPSTFSILVLIFGALGFVWTLEAFAALVVKLLHI